MPVAPVNPRIGPLGIAVRSFALVALALCLGCERQHPASRHDLFVGLRLARSATLVVPPELEAMARDALSLRPTLAGVSTGAPGGGPADVADEPGALRIDVVVGAERRPGGAPSQILLGDPDTPALASLLPALGLVRAGAEGAFTLRGLPDLGEVDLLAATFADPERNGLPVSLLVCADLAASADPASGSGHHMRELLRELEPGSRPHFRAWRGGDLVADGALSLDGAPSPERTAMYLPERLGMGRALSSSRGIELRADPNSEAFADAYLVELRRVRKELVRVTASPKRDLPEIRVRAFGHAEDLLRSTGSSALFSRNPATGDVATVIGAFDDGGMGYGGALALELLGHPAEPWMVNALALHVAGRWWGQPLEAWVARLASAGLVPADPELVLTSRGGLSEHLTTPLGAAYLRFLLAEREVAAAEWWAGLELPHAQLWGEFRAWLLLRSAALAGERASAKVERAARLAERGFLRGANLCAPSNDLVDPGEPLLGFGSRACDRSLNQLANLGANSTALCLKGVGRWNGARGTFEPRRRSPYLLASDLDVVHTVLAARERGLGVMLRPLVFETPSGTWAGEHAEESEARHEAFFERYGRLLVHVALLGELGGAELLCVGTELPKATRGDPDEDPWIPDFTNENADRWRGLVASARGVFSGAVTYAADARGESERIDFWDAFDFSGVDLFWSLLIPAGDEASSEPTSPTSIELVQRLRNCLARAMEVGSEAGRPCLITEIGFPSSAEGWRFTDQTRGAPSPGEQARMLEALAIGFRSLEIDPTLLGGIYVFNWSTDPTGGSLDEESYTPQGRPGLQGLGRLFTAAVRLSAQPK